MERPIADDFARLYEEYLPRILNYMRLRVDDEALAEDLTALTFERAREAGVPEDLLQRVHTPIGLDIGAETPREIAVAVIAEIIAVQRGKEV